MFPVYLCSVFGAILMEDACSPVFELFYFLPNNMRKIVDTDAYTYEYLW